MPRNAFGWRAGQEAHLYQLRGASEPNHADEDAALYPANERILQKARKSPLGRGASLHALQLLPRASDLTSYSGDGSGNHRSRLVNRRGDSTARYGESAGSLASHTRARIVAEMINGFRRIVFVLKRMFLAECVHQFNM